jgi:metal-sulfur cluster biosynthetic enzyme
MRADGANGEGASPSDYKRPSTDPGAGACHYTSYESNARSAEYDETDAVDGDVPATGAGATGLERRVWQALYDVRDPEMPVSVVDLGLIYRVDVDKAAGQATVDMTLTYTGCPARDMLLGEVERSVAAVEGVESVDLRLVWSPAWTVELVTPEGREALREFGVSV